MAASNGIKFMKNINCLNYVIRSLPTINKGVSNGRFKMARWLLSRCRPHGARLVLLVPGITTVHAVGWPSWSTTEQKEEKPAVELKPVDDVTLIVNEADRLYAANEVYALYQYLQQYKNMDNDEILWRLARATVDKGKVIAEGEERRTLYFKAFSYITRALALNEDNFAVHKWYAILLDYTGQYEGTKKRIENAYLVKKHFLAAIELNPTDATSLHTLGYWCFTITDIPWYQRSIASAVFETPPKSSYEEALTYFTKAEEIDPNFYSMNLLMVGKTHLRLKNRKLAIAYLYKTRDYGVKTADDQQAHDEAVQLLKSLGEKVDS